MSQQQTNTTVRGALAATSDVTPTYRYRRQGSPWSTLGVTIYTPTGGAWVGTMTIQISDPDRNVWTDLEQWTADGFKGLTPPCDCDLRIEFTARTSGTAIGAIINNA